MAGVFVVWWWRERRLVGDLGFSCRFCPFSLCLPEICDVDVTRFPVPKGPEGGSGGRSACCGAGLGSTMIPTTCVVRTATTTTPTTATTKTVFVGWWWRMDRRVGAMSGGKWSCPARAKRLPNRRDHAPWRRGKDAARAVAVRRRRQGRRIVARSFLFPKYQQAAPSREKPVGTSFTSAPSF